MLLFSYKVNQLHRQREKTLTFSILTSLQLLSKSFTSLKVSSPDILQSIVFHHGWTKNGMLKKFGNIENHRVDENWESKMPGFVLLPDRKNWN